MVISNALSTRIGFPRILPIELLLELDHRHNAIQERARFPPIPQEMTHLR